MPGAVPAVSHWWSENFDLLCDLEFCGRYTHGSASNSWHLSFWEKLRSQVLSVLGVSMLAKQLRKSYNEENYTFRDVIMYSRTIIAHEPYFVVHTAQAPRGNSEEGKPVGLQCLLTGAEFRRAQSHPTQLKHNPQSPTFTLCKMYQPWHFSGSSVDADAHTCILVPSERE